MVGGEVVDDDGDGVGEHHEAGDGLLEVAADGLFEAFDLDEAVGCGYAELVDEGEDRAGGDAAAAVGVSGWLEGWGERGEERGGGGEGRERGGEERERWRGLPDSNEGIQTRVIPATDVTFIDEFGDLPFAHDCACKVETAIPRLYKKPYSCG